MSEVLVGDWKERVPSYFRVASLSVAAYDWLWTLPIEWEIYREQESILRLGRGCLLFILIRYSSICALTASNAGFFTHGFSPAACGRYRYFPPSMKGDRYLFQSAIAQLILFIRTWAISRHATWVLLALSALFVISVALESWSNIYKLVAVQNEWYNCTSGNYHETEFVWIHYLMCMVFDGACLGIAAGYLWMQSTDTTGVRGLARSLLRQGVLYWVVLTTVNVANLITYRVADLSAQASAASIGYTLIWIMAQRILIQLHNLRTSGSVHADCTSICDFMGCSRAYPSAVAQALFKHPDASKLSLGIAVPNASVPRSMDLEARTGEMPPSRGEGGSACAGAGSESKADDETELDITCMRDPEKGGEQCMIRRLDAIRRTRD
ncbi:hypothetical protein OBBRIDRAFT_771885 [Obba rivulosa]|uniref:DUF6533 domain-containing protein n=1 Tax=Obba rivulosa TaxID=1052685 RepID=A0A8E2DPA2_9APHY|nr:hypothetical protein OBBRIDRAFT_771885 [Obba rivulosa]